jgi:hypothetical protein
MLCGVKNNSFGYLLIGTKLFQVSCMYNMIDALKIPNVGKLFAENIFDIIQ